MSVVVSGWLRVATNGEEDDILYLVRTGPSYWKDTDHMYMEEPLSALLAVLHKKNVTIRYFISERPMGLQEAEQEYLKIVLGMTEAKYEMRYTDVTGYIYTTENLMVGGHDLLKELKPSHGRYLIFEYQIHPDVPVPQSQAKFTTEQRIAVALHKLTCRENHVEVCGWEWEEAHTYPWLSPVHAKYLKWATQLVHELHWGVNAETALHVLEVAIKQRYV